VKTCIIQTQVLFKITFIQVIMSKGQNAA